MDPELRSLESRAMVGWVLRPRAVPTEYMWHSGRKSC